MLWQTVVATEIYLQDSQRIFCSILQTQVLDTPSTKYSSSQSLAANTVSGFQHVFIGVGSTVHQLIFAKGQ